MCQILKKDWGVRASPPGASLSLFLSQFFIEEHRDREAPLHQWLPYPSPFYSMILPACSPSVTDAFSYGRAQILLARREIQSTLGPLFSESTDTVYHNSVPYFACRIRNSPPPVPKFLGIGNPGGGCFFPIRMIFIRIGIGMPPGGDALKGLNHILPQSQNKSVILP